MTREIAQRGFRVGAAVALGTGILSVLLSPATLEGMVSMGTFVFALAFLAAMVVIARRG